MTQAVMEPVVRPKPVVMGILNVTPDSFSDGGRWLDPDEAVAHAVRMVQAGAGIVDVGGESTRPGARRASEDEELARVVPVVQALVSEGITVSVDTMRSAVAGAALEYGASLVNDVSGGLADRAMGPLIASSGARLVVMHWRGHSADMQRRVDYSMYEGYAQDGAAMGSSIPPVVAGVSVELAARVAALHDHGVQDDQLIVDPGLGFAKTAEHNWQLLAHLDRVEATLGLPVLVGASRKSFLGPVAAPSGEADVGALDRASAVCSLVVAQAGAWGVRVHDVEGTMVALAVAKALQAARDGAEPR